MDEQVKKVSSNIDIANKVFETLIRLLVVSMETSERVITDANEIIAIMDDLNILPFDEFEKLSSVLTEKLNEISAVYVSQKEDLKKNSQ